MKKLLYLLSAALMLFACKSQIEPTPSEDPLPGDTFEVSELDPLSAEAQNFSVEITTSISDFKVVIPSDVTWLSHVSTKADVQKKSVEFAVTLNEESKMRQARVTFTGEGDKTLGTLAVQQKAGGGIEFDAVTPEPVAVEGDEIVILITSNVPYTAATEADWITIGAVTSEGQTVTVAPNPTAEAREAEINFYREGTDNLIGIVTLTQKEPHVILNGVGYADLESALLAYEALAGTETATLVLDEGVHAGDIIVGETNAALTVSGAGENTILDGSIEIQNKSVTLENFTIESSKEGSLPAFETTFNYQHGIMVHSAGAGVTIAGVTVKMTNLASDATGIFLLSETTGYGHDVIRSTTVDGGSAGHRLIQAYGAKASLTSNTFKNPYSSYAVRIGGENGDVVLANNVFEGKADCGVHFYNLASSSITFGNGARDNNKFADGFATAYKANSDVTAAGNTFYPVVTYSASTGVVEVYLDPDAMASLDRVWGFYNGSTGVWDDAITSCSNWNRNAIISDRYIYMTIAGNAAGSYGVAVFNLSDGSYIRTITEGFPMEGRFWTCGIAKLNAGESDVIYVSNMAIGDNGEKLQIYRLTDLDSEGIPTKAEVAMDGYDVPAGERFGDKMTSYGDNDDGLLFFVSFTRPGTYRSNMEFKVDAGEINPEPIISPFLGTAGGNSTGSIHMFAAQGTGVNATRQAFYGSNFDFRYLISWWWGTAAPDGWYQTKIEDGKGGTIVSDSGEDVYSNFGGVGLYDDNANDPQLFWIGGTRYVAYVTVNMDSQNKACGYLRLLQIPGVVDGSGNYPIMIAMYQNKDNPAYFQRYALGDPDDFFAVGHESTNKTAFCDVLQTPEGETYILAGITSTGVSLFKVDY